MLSILLALSLASTPHDGMHEFKDRRFHPLGRPGAALKILNPQGAGYDSTNVALTTGSGGAVTVTSATPRQPCPDSSGALRTLAANTPCVVDGLSLRVRSASVNNLFYSADYSQAAWSKLNITLATDTTLAPDGTAATKASATAGAATQIAQAAVVAATSATCSVYAHKGSGATDANRFQLVNTTTPAVLLSVTINYDTQAITYVTGASGATVTAYPNGWLRIALAASSGIVSGNTIRCDVLFSGSAETAGEYAYLYGVQLTPGAVVPGDYCPTTAGAGTCSAETVTTATPAALSRTEGCFKVCVTPSWTGANPLGATAAFAWANAAGTARLGYSTAGTDLYIAYDGTNSPGVAAGFTSGTRKCYLTQWSAANNFLRVTNLTSGATNSAAFTTLGAFDANIGIGSTVAGAAQANSNLDTIFFGTSPYACGS